MLQKVLLCLAAFVMVALSAMMVPSANHRFSNASVVSRAAGNVTVDVDHPPARLDVAVGATITFVRYGGAGDGGTSVTSYNSGGQVGLVLTDLPGGPIGTVHTFRAERRGDAQIVIRYAPAKNGLAQSAQITVRVH